ncbi:MAG: MFS transporter, partial [Acidimicrobiales bacterium]
MRREHAASKAPLPAGYGVIWSAVALDLVGFGIVLPILPLYAERFGASPSVIGLVLAAYSVGQLVGAPILGRLSDRYGRKPVLLLALAGSSLGHLVTGLAGSVWVVLAARAVDGLSGGSVSVAQAAVADLAPPAARARLFGLLGVAFAVGFVVGPALGSLAALGGPRLPFFLAAGLSGLNALTGLRRLPETRPAGAAPAGSAG